MLGVKDGYWGGGRGLNGHLVVQRLNTPLSPKLYTLNPKP